MHPVLITVYDRLSHLKMCIDALKKCPESAFTTLYVASDAAKNPQKIAVVKEIRDFVNQIDGFEKVVLISREENIGSYENYKRSKEEVFKTHQALIFLEDDVMVGLGFLRFINSALDIYKDFPEVIGVCSYLPPGVNFSVPAPVFLKSRAPYGFGAWAIKERELNKKQNLDYIKNCFSSFIFFREYEKNNPQVARSIPGIIRTGSVYPDILTSIVMQKEGWFAIYPPTSLSKTLGNDGTGVHAGKSKVLLDQRASDSLFELFESVNVQLSEVEQKIRSKYYNGIGISIINYAAYFIYRISSDKFTLDKKLFTAYRNIKKLLKNVRRDN